MAFDRSPRLDDDGLMLPEVGDWAETKYRLVATYSQMFATAMKGKWGARVYVDLFAGAGRARIAGTSRIVPTSAMLALQVRDPFDKYVFSDIDSDRLDALKTRSNRDAAGRDVCCVLGDCNVNVDRILNEIPPGSRGHRVLSFCVVDPYNLAGLKFATVASLSSRFVDFLVLIPSYMDAHRNLGIYSDPDNHTVDDFLGDSGWREWWAKAPAGGGSREFGAFVVDRFGCAMKALRYLYDGPGEEVSVRDQQNHLLYHLAFFSRSELGRKFWREARRYSKDQLDMFG